ncbi:TonB-dependent receptor [Sphingobium algorifonticola]|uniref:TonB-dependent receptor n=1 Tax=Sphingobium algorifonticola TaxID=2008318 RepID=A0A437J3T9_9SPHN|nr:TonB-dependent receptor [Sphingobium algorifonticola]RVT39164.1 TonB-dependent receptor [Sphingobium algorifonticola]
MRLASQGEGAFEWLVGTYFYREVNHLNSEIALSFPTPFGLQKFVGTSATRLVDRSQAAFGQASYTLAPGFKITAGGRVSKDRQRISAQRGGFIPNLISPGSDRFSTVDTDVSLKAAVQYEPSDAATLYATVSEGYKSAGINAAALPPSLAAQQIFRPERSINYEAGYKGFLFGRRLSLDAAIFYIGYNDLQVFRSDPLTFTNYVSNAEKARSYGAEIELRARLTDRLDVSGSAAINRTAYRRFAECAVGTDCTGNRLANAPSMTANGRVSYAAPLGNALELRIGTDISYVGRTYFEPTNAVESRRSGFAIWNLDVALSEIGKGWTLSAYAKNLTDRDYFTDTLEVPLATGGSAWRYLPAAPRTFGVRLRYGF